MNAVATVHQLHAAPDVSAMSGRQLADYVRGRLDLALSLASDAEQERRSKRWDSAERYPREWEGVMAEVNRLLPLVRTSGVPLFGSAKAAQPRPRRKGQLGLCNAR